MKLTYLSAGVGSAIHHAELGIGRVAGTLLSRDSSGPGKGRKGKAEEVGELHFVWYQVKVRL